MTISYSGPGQHHVTIGGREEEDEVKNQNQRLTGNFSFVDKVDEDRQALLNLERNIAIIERSMSASQLQSALHKGKRQVRPSQRIA